MNWLAWDARAYLGAALGGVLGALGYAALLPAHEAPWLLGLGLGLGSLLAARDRSTLRGFVLGAAALWASALAQCLWHDAAGAGGLPSRLEAFHSTLTLERLALHALGALLAGWFAARSVRRGARRRVAGA